MANRQAFGRRISAPIASRLAPVRAEHVSQSVTALFGGLPVETPSPVSTQTELPSIEQELEEWRRSRNRSFKVPWPQLSLMASLCFGIASAMLPDSVNDNVEWLLWILAAMSAFVWFTNRRKKVKEPASP